MASKPLRSVSSCQTRRVLMPRQPSVAHCTSRSQLDPGKAVEMELEAPDEAEARRRLELLSDRLLANPVIEDWSLELEQS